MKKACTTLLTLLTMWSLMAQISTPPATGDGSIGNPYQIATLENLNWIAENPEYWDNHYLQIADIDAAETAIYGWTPIAWNEDPWSPDLQMFNGQYNGQGFAIQNLSADFSDLDDPDNPYLYWDLNFYGLFGVLGEDAVVKNLRIVNLDIDVGGAFVGGVAGVNYGSIMHCYTSGFVGTPYHYGGGITGENFGLISACFSSCQVNGSDADVGGIAGSNGGTIENSFFTGNVDAYRRAGGIAGWNMEENSLIEHCYTNGVVSNVSFGDWDDVGPLYGANYDGTITRCYWDMDVYDFTTPPPSGHPFTTGGRTTAAMTFPHDENTYVDWDFMNIWLADESASMNEGYPYLKTDWPTAVLPSVTTLDVGSITGNTATLGGEITAEGGSAVSMRGFVWSTNAFPTLNNNIGIAETGSGTGPFENTITGLQAETVYYFRAYATNAIGTAYGTVMQFTTAGESTNELNLSFGQGFTWFSVNVNPGNMDLNNLFVDLEPCYDDRIIGQTSFALYTGTSWAGTLNQLLMDRMYRMRLCSQQAITISGEPAPTSPINLNPGYTWLGFVPQNCLSINEALSGLDPGPSYDDRLIGQGSFALYSGTSWIGTLQTLCPGGGYIIRMANAATLNWQGNQIGVPTVSTAEIINITMTSATSGGIVNSDGGTDVTERGIVWSTQPSPTLEQNEGLTIDGTGTGEFVSQMDNLSSGTSYYVRAYATNSEGAGYGNEYEFTTSMPAHPDGLYLTGTATPYQEIVLPALFEAGINSNTNTTQEGLYEKYVMLEALQNGFNFVFIEEGLETTLGPSTVEFIPTNGENNQPDIIIQKGTLQSSDAFMVQEDGFYHIIVDMVTNTYVIAPVPYWGLIGTSTPGGWITDFVMEFIEDNDGIRFEALNAPMQTGEFKFRYGGGWVLEIDGENLHVSTNFGGIITGELPDLSTTIIRNGPPYHISQEIKGSYDVKLHWTADAGFTSQLTKTGDLELIDYSQTELGLIGESLIVNGQPHGWSSTIMLQTPEQIENTTYRWTFEQVELAKDYSGFKIREGQSWGGIVVGYHDALLLGFANYKFTLNNDENFIPLESGFYDIILEIDALTDARKMYFYREDIEYSLYFVPGSYQGWDPTNHETVLYDLDGEGYYQGYLHFQDEVSEFKFTPAPTWELDYGDNNNDGILDQGGQNIIINEAGYYRLTVNLNDMSYSVVKNDWNIYGSATGAGPETDVAMNFNPVTLSWYLYRELTQGNFLFRDNTGLVYGVNGEEGNVGLDGQPVEIMETGSYLIRLCLDSIPYNYSIIQSNIIPCPGDETVEDIDGNIYNTILIGDKCWLVESLMVKKYNDGTSIPTGHTNQQWASLTSGAYAVYPHASFPNFDSEADVLQSYGALYNWYAASSSQLCPEGWRVSSNDDWTDLLLNVQTDVHVTNNYLDPLGAANILRSCRQVDSPLGGNCSVGENDHPRWGNHYRGVGIDFFGFDALPGGHRTQHAFGNAGHYGWYWTSSELTATVAHAKGFSYIWGNVSNDQLLKYYGHSVRCVKDVSTSTVQPCPDTPTVTDIDGNVYPTVLIGDQCWMGENLKTTHYRNGSNIDFPVTEDDWYATENGSYAWYDDNVSWKHHYGALYNWFAVNDEKGLCPSGWGIPSISDWDQMVLYLGEDQGGKLKSTATEPDPHPRWNDPNVGATNETGFGAIPGGWRSWNGYEAMGETAHFWTSTEMFASSAILMSIFQTNENASPMHEFKLYGLSVRCIKNE